MSKRRYRLCGLIMETDWPQLSPLWTAGPSDQVDLRFTVVGEPPRDGQWTPAGGRQRKKARTQAGWIGDTEVIRIPRVGDAWLVDDHEIVFHLIHPEKDYQVEFLLLGPLLAYWLELHGFTVLHGAAAAGSAGAVGLVGPNGSGKTSLALALGDLGWRLVTDDLMCLSAGPETTVFPSFPQVRLWPPDAERRFGADHGLEPAHPRYDKLRVVSPGGAFVDSPRPLTALYLPLRRANAAAPHIERVSGPPALFHLMFNTWAIRLVDVPAHRRDWLKRLATLLERVPLFALTYPDDLARSAEVAQAVADHSRALKAPSL